MRPPTSEEKCKFHRCDAELVGFEQHEGWKTELPFYRFKCKEHGYVIDYEHGYDSILFCPNCLKEESFNRKNPKTL
jgi:hypothetical protein